MKLSTIKYAIIGTTIISLTTTSCKKQDDWLNVKQTRSDVVPSTLPDYQALLDNDYVMNRSTPSLGMLGSDNYYITYENFQTLTAVERNGYTWAKDIFQGQSDFNWNGAYQAIEYANVVLDGILSIPQSSTNENSWNNIKGAALFYRSFYFYQLAILFSKPYDSVTASQDLGIPIRLSSDVNIKSTRATLKETYIQIINDLKTAEALLPPTPTLQTRPSKIAVDALLAKIYLDLSDFSNSNLYASKGLALYSTLLDYNTIPDSFSWPQIPNNPEVIFWSVGHDYGLTGLFSFAIVDSTLFNSYNDDDLRKALLFYTDGRNIGSYAGYAGNFSGLSVDDLYLIRAETSARNGDATSAMKDLNILLAKRWKTGSFADLTETNADAALSLILNERRKEFPFVESSRWVDLRRLNKDPRFAKTLTRNLNGQIYTLLPNDIKYTYPIPSDEIKFSGIQQNPRE